MPSINLYMGCMYSGKTSELIREQRRQQKIGRNILCINYSDDNRYSNDNYIVSHNEDKIKCVKIKNLCDLSENIINSSDAIFIDEGQFFSDLKEYVIKWCEQLNKDIYIIGLDGDFKRQPFGDILNLIPYCDNVVKLKALCTMCNDGTEALFSHRLINTKDQISINNYYVALCRKHYLQSNQIIEN
jgi:thymidine kinase